jgi:hypothetical protein
MKLTYGRLNVLPSNRQRSTVKPATFYRLILYVLPSTDAKLLPGNRFTFPLINY